MKTLKKKIGFTSLISSGSLVVVAIIGSLAFFAVSAYQDYMRRQILFKTIVKTLPLREAINKCLTDTNGNVTVCNDFSSDKLAKYGVTAAPTTTGDFLSVSVVKSNAAIRIVGSSVLGMCILDRVPSFHKIGDVDWEFVMQTPGAGGDSLEKCKTYINIGVR